MATWRAGLAGSELSQVSPRYARRGASRWRLSAESSRNIAYLGSLSYALRARLSEALMRIPSVFYCVRACVLYKLSLHYNSRAAPDAALVTRDNREAHQRLTMNYTHTPTRTQTRASRSESDANRALYADVGRRATACFTAPAPVRDWRMILAERDAARARRQAVRHVGAVYAGSIVGALVALLDVARIGF